MKKGFVFVFLILLSFVGLSQSLDSVSFGGLKFRSIGPGFMSGRISDIAIDPSNESHWYIATGSGGVWETKNAGVTFKSIFDGQKVYSIGCITVDASNPNNVFVGTGENVGGRHASYGDGVYKSENGGKSWKNIGLPESEHISKIILHPTDKNTIWVASQGPLWNSGGERGVYKTTNGGKKWKRVLGDDMWQGATDLLIDPRDPNVLYAATWERHRNVAAYLGGGAKTGIYKSTDGGEKWTELKSGLPSGNMGKIGLAISPQQPDVLYAAIELDLRKGGVYRSANKGASWKKMSDKVGGGTGPHYYQELYASPHQFDRIYMANNYLLVSDNGGKDFKNVKKQNKHVDNHAMAFKSKDKDYLIVGTDGGLYESFDLAKNWRHFGNLPLTQFYKIALDDAQPFYNIYGGTQDNNTQRGPSRTNNRTGIARGDWNVVLGGDGHQPATEPGNPNIAYGQSQQGYYSRIDVATGEVIGIKPQPGADEGFERYNWDAPILVSPHSPQQIYVASHRLWKSENRGDKWVAISEDLTRNEERFSLPIMGKVQSFNNPWDVYAMSTYNTITSISESAVQKDLIYVGTDDGLIQITEDGGETWDEIKTEALPGLKERAYVNDIKADLHDANVVYLVVDNHKSGDYGCYVYKSKNKGRSWKRINKGIKTNHYAWRIVQDHKNPELLFLGTEFGLYFSNSGGDQWKELSGGLPRISYRDLAIHKREDDLVVASFGRGIFIMDDIQPFREVNDEVLEQDAHVFELRDADLYVPRLSLGYSKGGSLGGQQYIADNPQFGAVITYYLKDGYTSAKSKRIKEEKKLKKAGKDIPFKGWDELDAEKTEKAPVYHMIISNSKGEFVTRLDAPAGKGFHRITWNLRGVQKLPINQNGHFARAGFLVPPGVYKATLVQNHNGEEKQMADAVEFEVKALYDHSIKEVDRAVYNSFVEQYTNTLTEKQIADFTRRKLTKKLKALEAAMKITPGVTNAQQKLIFETNEKLNAISQELKGSPSKNEVGEKTHPTIQDRLYAVNSVLWNTSYGPTQTAMDQLNIVDLKLADVQADVAVLDASINALYEDLRKLGIPVILGFD